MRPQLSLSLIWAPPLASSCRAQPPALWGSWALGPRTAVSPALELGSRAMHAALGTRTRQA